MAGAAARRIRFVDVLQVFCMSSMRTINTINQALAQHWLHSKWLKVVTILMAVVVFWTTYALILPAITQTSANKVFNCTAAAQTHQHTAACYGTDGLLTCGKADFVLHTHQADACYDAEGNLVCTLPEITPHTHTADCYVTSLTCENTDPAHTHTDACYTQQAACGKSELAAHTHTDACYTTTTAPAGPLDTAAAAAQDEATQADALTATAQILADTAQLTESSEGSEGVTSNTTQDANQTSAEDSATSGNTATTLATTEVRTLTCDKL
jgi:hypothetical protein